MSTVRTLPKDVIEFGDHFYIRAQSSLADDRTLVLLHGDTFAIFDRFGDIHPVGFGQQGIFRQDTRYLSCLELRILGERPLLLSSTVREDNVVLAADLTNPDLELPSGMPLPRGTVHIYRTKFLIDGVCSEQIELYNYSEAEVDFDLTIAFHADFCDIFEVRGQKRLERGTALPLEITPKGVTLSYRGLDNIVRRTVLHSSSACCTFRESELAVPIQLQPHAQTILSLTISCESNGSVRPSPSYDHNLARASSERALSPIAEADIYTSNAQFNEWLSRSQADLNMMTTATPFGPYPYAGVPWFSTVFGRDGIITAFELLWLTPMVAKGVLSYLAANQATSSDPVRDAEPGKILHEVREGEMAKLSEVPFGRYYGSVDSTPLFLALAGAYYDRTGDADFLRSIWPNIETALEWIDRFGDRDGDGFVEYARQTESGLLQQGWKDSHDSVFHADGRLAAGPIALCEVQAYVYAAKSRLVSVASDLGFNEKAEKLRVQAEHLKNRFEGAFWCDDIAMYALALDGEKRQCRVRSSNAGQCLFAEIASPLRAQSIAESLLSCSLFSGWGIRTIASTEKRYNPMSYHNGSVWPHDNALIALGVSRSRDKRLALSILSGLLDLSIFSELHLLPELICGFPRRPGKGPTLYPVACAPQAWAAGAVFLVLQACLGVSIQAKESRIYLHRPALPEALEYVRIRNLRVGTLSLDLVFERNAETVAIDIQRRSGDIDVIAIK
jgi:glycogen debranching enzyme